MRSIKGIKIILSIIVFSLLFLLTGCCGGRYSYYTYRKKGEEALIAKNYKKAQNYYSTIYTNESKKTNADIVVCTTGIAGPTGATPNKPVGLIYVAIKSKYKAIVREFRLNPKLSRAKMKYRFTQVALEMLYDFLSDISA